jgi:serralysin
MASDTPPDDTPPDPNPLDTTSPKGGSYGGPYNPTDLDPNVRATMIGSRWTTEAGGLIPETQLTYYFSTSADDYTAIASYPSAAMVTNGAFSALSGPQVQAVMTALNQIQSYTRLSFAPADSGLAADAALRFANSTQARTSESRFPSWPNNYYTNDARDSGDTFLGPTGQISADWTTYFGTFEFSTIEHEIGHALGLKHGHDTSGNGALSADRNDLEFSIMTYASYLGADPGAGSTVDTGSMPRTFMMYDIAALQAYYGANWDRVGTAVTWSWNPTTGAEMIGGAAAPDIGATSTGKIFSTVWTQGAIATYDLSDFTADQVDDMRPGAWLMFSPDQLAVLNFNDPDTKAQGNVYNALLYGGDTGSEISNLNSGSGNDRIDGNDLANVVHANGGNDWMRGWAGDDALYGEGGDDTLIGEDGSDDLIGGLGDDSYVITSSGASIIEIAGEGIDSALIAVDGYTVGAYVDIAYLGVGVSVLTGNDTGMSLFARDGQAATITGGSGNDAIYGADGADVLNGGAGDDYLRGRSGNDTLRGGAHDDVLIGEDGSDTLIGGTGNDFYIVTSVGSTIVELPGEGTDSALIAVDGYTVGAYVDIAYLGVGVSVLTGNDTGMSLFARDGQAATITGGSGADWLYGANQTDVLKGGAGDDYLRGRAGNDTLEGGADNDTLIGEDGSDTLIGGTGDDFYIVTSVGSTIVEQPGEGIDSALIAIDGYTVGDNVEVAYLGAGVSTVTGNNTDMTILAREGQGATIIGGSGGDILLGADQADFLRGGQGSDVLEGGAGNDTYAFARGDGNDRMHASASTGSDTVAFDAGTAYDQLWFARSVNDLVISVIGEDQSLTVDGWYASPDNRFASIGAGDGYTATASAVDLLVQAMSAFTPPPLGQTTLPAELAADLAPALAANWHHA